MGGTPCPANASYVNKINSSSFGRINFRQCLQGALPAAVSRCAGKPYPGAFNVFRTCAAISDAIGTIFNLPIVLTSLRKFPIQEGHFAGSLGTNLSAIRAQIPGSHLFIYEIPVSL